MPARESAAQRSFLPYPPRPQAMGIYIAMNIASSLALTAYTKAPFLAQVQRAEQRLDSIWSVGPRQDQICAQIPGYDEFVKSSPQRRGPQGPRPRSQLLGTVGGGRIDRGPASGHLVLILRRPNSCLQWPSRQSLFCYQDNELSPPVGGVPRPPNTVTRMTRVHHRKFAFVSQGN